MDIRTKYLYEKRKLLALHTSQFFTEHLSQRGFSGYISFNHKEETLKLIVSTVLILTYDYEITHLHDFRIDEK